MSRSNRRAPRSRSRAQGGRAAGADVDALLASFGRCRAPEDRARIGLELASAGVEDDRVRAALVGMLEDDPLNGAACLSALGDRRVLRDLARAVDRLVTSPIGDCEICQAEHLVAVVTAVRVLGGTLSDEQLEKVEVVLERAAKLWIPLEGGSSSGAPTAFVRCERDAAGDGSGSREELRRSLRGSGAHGGADRDEEDTLH